MKIFSPRFFLFHRVERCSRRNRSSRVARPDHFSVFPFRAFIHFWRVAQTERPRLRLDRVSLARVCSDERWSREVKDRVEAYRRDVRRGVNPFEGAFPLWRNEQFVAAVVDAFEKTPGDPGRLATFAETERAVLLEAQRRELRLLNQRDARERGEDTEAERATCTAIAPTDALKKAGADETRRDPDDFTSENCTVAQSHENDALAAGLGEDDGEEVEVEGDVAVEEGPGGIPKASLAARIPTPTRTQSTQSLTLALTLAPYKKASLFDFGTTYPCQFIPDEVNWLASP